MKVKDVATAITQIAPLGLAQPWDNVGLLVGSPDKNLNRILLTIDVTKAVIAEAKKTRAELIISYHPVIWDGLKNVTTVGPGNIVHELIRSGIAVFSIHTALDAAAGGVNDGLAEMVGIVDGEPIGDYVDYPDGKEYKLVVFVPVETANKVAAAVFSTGAGAIGNYSNCAFQTAGTGTFLPLNGARPAIGKKGRFEKVPEVRFETIVPAERLDAVVAAMKRAHPYETPAFDIYSLHKPDSKYGLGRIGKLAKPSMLREVIARIKKQTGAKAVGFVGDKRKMVETAAVCAGSCGEIINQVIAAGADLYVTGELKHHQALAAQEAGLTCICLSHTVSERFILKKLAKQLQKMLKAVTITISRKDTDPFIWKNI
jgi:dinuclear metal center YbgI/SA1388 family protein